MIEVTIMSVYKRLKILIPDLQSILHNTVTIILLIVLSVSPFIDVHAASTNSANEDFENAYKIDHTHLGGIIFDNYINYQGDAGARLSRSWMFTPFIKSQKPTAIS